MPTYDDVDAFLAELPGITVGERWGTRTWGVGKRSVAWERPFTKADLRRFGEEPVPDGPILAVTTEDLHEKEAVLAEGRRGVFTIPHFDGYAAVLVQLRRIGPRVLERLLLEAWLSCVPAEIAEEELRTRRGR